MGLGLGFGRASERPSETTRARTVMQKPCTPIVFMRRDMSVFSASLFCTATWLGLGLGLGLG